MESPRMIRGFKNIDKSNEKNIVIETMYDNLPDVYALND